MSPLPRSSLLAGANTAKEGDKPLELESEEERTKRQLQAKMRAIQKAKENAEAAKKDRAELQQMQKVGARGLF